MKGKIETTELIDIQIHFGENGKKIKIDSLGVFKVCNKSYVQAKSRIIFRKDDLLMPKTLMRNGINSENVLITYYSICLPHQVQECIAILKDCIKKRVNTLLEAAKQLEKRKQEDYEIKNNLENE